MKKFGMELPEYAVEHAKNTTRGLTVWLSTLGAGIAPERRDDVQQIWNILQESQPHLRSAIDHLRNVEMQTELLAGSESEGMFDVIDDDEWIKSCSYVPSVFVKRFSD